MSRALLTTFVFLLSCRVQHPAVDEPVRSGESDTMRVRSLPAGLYFRNGHLDDLVLEQGWAMPTQAVLLEWSLDELAGVPWYMIVQIDAGKPVPAFARSVVDEDMQELSPCEMEELHHDPPWPVLCDVPGGAVFLMDVRTALHGHWYDWATTPETSTSILRRK